MSDPKRPVSRRDFIRLAALSSGLSIALPEARDGAEGLHASQTDASGRPKLPWWVRRVEQPTMEVNWGRMERFDERARSVRGPGMVKYVGAERADQLERSKMTLLQRRLEKGAPGYSLKDHALQAAHSAGPEITFLGPQMAATPQDRGVSRWEGAPEEAAQILRAAMRHMGAAQVGFLELEERYRKLIYTVDPDGKRLVFTAEEIAWESESARHIPLKCRYVIVYTVQMSAETLKRAPTVLGSQTTSLSYLRGRQIQNSTQEFLRSLGYQGLAGPSQNGLGIAPAFAVLSGLGEMSRLNRLITPQFGPMVRVFKMLTDLPVAPDRPIDAGIMNFCRHCKKCAEACGAEALSFSDEPFWQVRGGWNNPGHKAYFEDSVACNEFQLTNAGTNCGICFAVCPFSKKDEAWIHDLVKATASSAPFLDGFIRSMDDALGYGAQKDPELWWSLDLPEHGCDSTRPVSS
jgi:reductive dehalogenase